MWLGRWGWSAATSIRSASSWESICNPVVGRNKKDPHSPRRPWVDRESGSPSRLEVNKTAALHVGSIFLYTLGPTGYCRGRSVALLWRCWENSTFAGDL